MKMNFAIVASIVLAVGIVALGFTFFQIRSERNKLQEDLRERVALIADEFDPQILEREDPFVVKSYIENLKNKFKIFGVSVFFGTDSIISNQSATLLSNNSIDLVNSTIASDSIGTDFFKFNSNQYFQYAKPLRADGIATGAIVFYSDAQYINRIINSIWLRNFLRWFLQAMIVSVITVIVIRWSIFTPLGKVVKWVEAVRQGNIEKIRQHPAPEFLEPLKSEILNIAHEINEAKAVAAEEARLRSHSESIWTPGRLKAEVENILHGRKMIVVSNREPYMHIHDGKKIKCIVPASGMISAMEPILKACGGLWIASGTGDADREVVDKDDKIMVPPEQPKYTLKRLWQTKEEENHFYYGFSNEGLWPLCHIAHTRPTFREEDWFFYKKVNADFAKAVLDETKDEKEPLILIQDYHFALLPSLIRKAKPKARIALFWHIPWPNPESFGIVPWQREILSGMLGADLIGFHTQYHCNHFLETVNNALESRVRWEDFAISIGTQTSYVKPFPISIDFTLRDMDRKTDFRPAAEILDDFGISAQYMGVGVDRIDYTKGIVEKFLAIERFLEKNPEYLGKFTFVQIGAPSRTLIKSYADTVNAVEQEAERINWRFKAKNWKAILLLKRHHSHEEILPFYVAANMCMVTSLHDGMNLVAKEFIAKRSNNTGSLILSCFAGASHELREALIVNPYNIEEMAGAIKKALEMPPEEQSRRMKQMRQTLLKNNIYTWAADLLRTMEAVPVN